MNKMHWENLRDACALIFFLAVLYVGLGFAEAMSK